MLKVKLKAIVHDDPYDITPFTVHDVSDAAAALKVVEEAARKQPPYRGTVFDENLKEISIDDLRAMAANARHKRDMRGWKACEISASRRILIPPYGGSNPPAPASPA